MAEERFDAIIVGSGQAGNPLAKAMGEHGWSIALVERSLIGGTCVNIGCTPTKTLVASARVAYLARRGADFGVRTGEVLFDLPAAIARKDTLVHKSRHGSRKRLEGTKGITLLFGEASFSKDQSADVHALDVRTADGSTRRIVSERVILDTGLRPDVPKIEGLDAVPFLDSTSIMELQVLPEHLIVLGGGVVALEFAQMFRRFGSRVTVIERGEHLATHEDEDICENIEAIFREDGIDVLLKTSVDRVTGNVEVHTANDTVSGSHLLVATGRIPNTDALMLTNAGVTLDDHGFIKVNDKLETTTKGIWAVGDVKSGPAFTHISYDDYRILKTNLLDGGSASIGGRLSVYAMFTDPELGRVGMSEREARKSGHNLLMASMPMTYMARAAEMGETRGLLKVIVDADTEQILGTSVLGIDGGDIAAQIQIAMMGKLPYPNLRDGIFIHPTRSEIMNALFGALKPIS